mgnify:CR=1 FL=1
MSPLEGFLGTLLLILTFVLGYLWISLKKTGALYGAITSLVLAMLLFLSFRIVPPGHRGVYTWLGSVEPRVAGEGFTLLVPGFESLHLVDVRVTPHDFKQIEAASKELLAVTMTGKLNYRIDPTRVNELYQKVGLDFPNKVLAQARSDFLK